MSADITSLLFQVCCESGSSLFRRVQSAKRPVSTGIAPLDEAIQSVTASKEHSDNEASSSSAQNSIIEILGMPGSGKTQTLYRVVIAAVLPEYTELPLRDCDESESYERVRVGGSGLHVVYIDVDGKMDVHLLAKYMRTEIQQKISSSGSAVGSVLAGAEEIEGILKTAMDRVHVFRPLSTRSLIATLGLLPRYLSESNVAGPSGVVVLVDDVGANYWMDCEECNYIKVQSKTATPWFRLQQNLVGTMIKVQAQLECLFIVTVGLHCKVTARKHQSSEAVVSSSNGGSPKDTSSTDVRVFDVGAERYRDIMILKWQRQAVSRSFLLERGGPVVADGRSRSGCADKTEPSVGCQYATPVRFLPVVGAQIRRSLAATYYVTAMGLGPTASFGLK